MKVSGLGHFPLGTPVPNREHAVCVSLPTLNDLIGYEEKNAETLSKLPSGYPRFVRHRKISELADYWDHEEQNTKTKTFFFSEIKDWIFAQELLGIPQASVEQKEDYVVVRLSKKTKAAEDLQKFLQHAGCGISSRHAEQELLKLGVIANSENLSANENAETEIKNIISKAHGPNVKPEDLLLAASGANAFTSAFRGALEIARSKKQKIWIRLGWLYLDTIEIMNLLVNKEECVISLNHPSEFGRLKKIFQENSNEIAGLVTEFPSNPLLHSCDLEEVKGLCDLYDSTLIVDPTMASPKNAKVSNYADVVINSLTKYANWEGDVMMGSAVFPSHSRRGMAIKKLTEDYLTKPYQKDLERLSEQITFYDNFIEQTNCSQIEIVEYLRYHKKIKNLYWAYQQETGGNYRKIAGDKNPGCVLSFEVNGGFPEFYNSLKMLKSPSFGTEFTLCCPYVYLAHYNLVASNSGKKELSLAGLSPELCRLSVGMEPVDEIKQTLDEALQKC